MFKYKIFGIKKNKENLIIINAQSSSDFVIRTELFKESIFKLLNTKEDEFEKKRKEITEEVEHNCKEKVAFFREEVENSKDRFIVNYSKILERSDNEFLYRKVVVIHGNIENFQIAERIGFLAMAMNTNDFEEIKKEIDIEISSKNIIKKIFVPGERQ